MFKVLIADDEELICELIANSIVWEEMGIELIGWTNDGISAYDIAIKNNADLIITDIRMPGLDGISLIKKVIGSLPNCRFIVISGYQDFEYVKDALKLGVVNYILKPIDEDELSETIKTVKTDYQKQMETLMAEEHNQEHLRIFDETQMRLRESYLSKLLKNVETDRRKDIENINSEYGFTFENGIFVCAIITIDGADYKNDDGTQHNFVFEKISELFCKFLKKTCYCIYFTEIDNNLACILNYSMDNSTNVKNLLNEILKHINQTQIGGYYEISIGMGTETNEYTLLSESYKSARLSAMSRIVCGKNKLIDIREYNFVTIDINGILTIEWENQFICMLEIMNIEAAKNCIINAFDKLKYIENVDPTIYFEIYEYILEIFHKTLRQAFQECLIDGNLIENSKMQAVRCSTPMEMVESLNGIIEEILNSCINFKQSQNRKTIELAITYIKNNYVKQIMLSDVADYVYLSPVYFCSLFKKEVGVNFTDYLTKYRMNVARRLLTCIQYNISEVSEKVGYKDTKYFSKLFKKVVGVSPAEYRKLHC